MSFERPTLNAIIERIQADLESRLKVPQLRRSNANIYGRVLAGVSHALHGYIEYIARQMFFDTADGVFLDRHASIFGLLRKPATKAHGEVKFSFTGEPVNVEVGTVLQTDDGIQFVTTGPAKDGAAPVQAILAGANGNVLKGDELTLTAPVAGVLSKVECLGIAGGADKESDDRLRGRLLNRVRETPSGGTKADYERWSLECAGVTRAWVYPKEAGAGTVVIRFVADDMKDILPTQEHINQVQRYIDSVRPVTAVVTVKAPTIKKIDFKITDLDPDDEQTKANVKAALVELLKRESYPGGKILISHVRHAISSAVGENDHKLVAPVADIESKAGELLAVGEVTWQ